MRIATVTHPDGSVTKFGFDSLSSWLAIFDVARDTDITITITGDTDYVRPSGG